jgi:hypothetical protein
MAKADNTLKRAGNTGYLAKEAQEHSKSLKQAHFSLFFDKKTPNVFVRQYRKISTEIRNKEPKWE